VTRHKLNIFLLGITIIKYFWNDFQSGKYSSFSWWYAWCHDNVNTFINQFKSM